MKLDDIFGIHGKSLALRAERSEVLASNLANADTPGYKARDFDFEKVLKSQVSGESTGLRATHQRHFGTQPSSMAVPSNELLYRIPRQPSLDGNTVDADMEQMVFTRNVLGYQASVEFLSGRIQNLKKAIKGQ